MFSRVNKRSKETDFRPLKGLVDRFKDALLVWVIHYQIVFVAIENSFFKDLIVIFFP